MNATPKQLELNRRGRFTAWQQRRASLVADLADCKARLVALRAPGTTRMGDPLTGSFIESQEARQVDCVERLRVHDAAGAREYSDLINPTAGAPVQSSLSPEQVEISALQAANNDLRTTVDNQRDEIRRLTVRLQSITKSVKESGA